VDHSTSHGVGAQNGYQLALGGTLNQWTYLDFPDDSPSKRNHRDRLRFNRRDLMDIFAIMAIGPEEERGTINYSR